MKKIKAVLTAEEDAIAESERLEREAIAERKKKEAEAAE